jgi:very-short-patch-repair endonuclease
VNDESLPDPMEPPQRIARGRPASSVPVRVARRLRKRMTPQEVKLWVKLREQRLNGLHFRRQVPIGPYVVDFACLKHRLVAEIDGGQHSFDNAVAADRSRDLTLNSLGFRVHRFWNAEVDANLDGVVETILATARSSLPAGEGRLGRQAERGGETQPGTDSPLPDSAFGRVRLPPWAGISEDPVS